MRNCTHFKLSKSKFAILFIMLGLTLVISGCFIPTSPTKLEYAFDMYGMDLPKNKQLYLSHNIWYNSPYDISTINFHSGTIIPFGTKIYLISSEHGKVQLKIDGNETIFTINNDKNVSLLPDSSAYNQIFTDKNPLQENKNIPKETLEKLEKGEIEVGMPQSYVVLAFGRPPIQLNPGKSSTWTYLINKGLKTVHYVFKNDKVTYIFYN